MNPIKNLLEKTGFTQSGLQREIGLKTVTTVWRWVNQWADNIPNVKSQIKLIEFAKKHDIVLTHDELTKRP